MVSLSCKDSTMLVTTSHIDEQFVGDGGTANVYYDMHDLQADCQDPDPDLEGKFRLALKKLEGLMYAALGAVPKSYASREQWWKQEHLRCLWPEQTFLHSSGQYPPPAPGLFKGWYWQTAAIGQIGGRLRGSSHMISPTGYFDWSRSDILPKQYLRLRHDAAWFPQDAVVRACVGGESYDDPVPNQKVRVTWTVPQAKRGKVQTATLFYKAGSGSLLQLTMTTSDGGTSYWAEIPGQPNETQVLFYLRVVSNESPAVTVFEPHGATPDAAPTLADIPADDPNSPPGSGHTKQQAGSCYYYYVLHHKAPYANGFPELIWEEYTGEKRQYLKRCTGAWQMAPWTTIRPGLINLARFCLQYLGNSFQHHPGHRGPAPACCFNMPILWRWTGGNLPWLYRDGGKGGGDGVRPLHNNPTQANAGDVRCRKTWRGLPEPFDYAPSMAWGTEAYEYGHDESWLPWPQFASFQFINDPMGNKEWPGPGLFPYHGKDRGLREGDRISKVHLWEIIKAVDYLIEYGLWFTRSVETCKKTPTTCYPLEVDGGPMPWGYWSDDWGSDAPEGSIYCYAACHRGPCPYPWTDPIVPWNRPVTIEDCRLARGDGVAAGLCGKLVRFEALCREGCPDADPPKEQGRYGRAGCYDNSEHEYPYHTPNDYWEVCTHIFWPGPDDPQCIFHHHIREGSTNGYACYLCGPARYYNAIGEGYYPQAQGGGRIWSAADEDHGNGCAKYRYGEHGNPAWEDQRGPQYTKPMGNSSTQAFVCHHGSGDAEVVSVPFDTIVDVEWSGPTVPWVQRPFCTFECRDFDDWSEVVPELPGLGWFGPYGTSFVREPLCHEFEHYHFDSGPYSRVRCRFPSGIYPNCNGTTVYQNVDLNLNGNGVPQLRDYDLTIRKLHPDGTPIVPAVYPDTIIEQRASDTIFTADAVQCPFDTWKGGL